MEHHFDIDIAKEYGVPEAIMLYNIRFWILHNKANGKHFHDGYYWTYNTREAFTKLFPYYTYAQIRRALEHLKAEGVIITGNYNPMPMDRKLWYAISEKGEKLFKDSKCNVQKSKMDLLNLANGNAIDSTAIADNNKNNNKDNNIISEEKPKSSKKDKKKDKEFVPPTLEQVQEYAKSRNSIVNAENFYDYYSASEWIDGKGEPVKVWKLKFLSWEWRDKKRAELQAAAENKLPKEQVNRFKALLKGTLKLEQWSKKERQIVSAIGFQELKLRRAGEEEKWLEKLCNEFIKLGD